MIVEDLYSEPYMLSNYEETPIVSLFMSKTIPFCIISQKSSVYPNLQDCANDPYPPRLDMQGLQLSLVPIGSTEPFLSRTDPLLESFLNMGLKLLALEAS